jgi:hypothetical protein
MTYAAAPTTFMEAPPMIYAAVPETMMYAAAPGTMMTTEHVDYGICSCGNQLMGDSQFCRECDN